MHDAVEGEELLLLFIAAPWDGAVEPGGHPAKCKTEKVKSVLSRDAYCGTTEATTGGYTLGAISVTGCAIHVEDAGRGRVGDVHCENTEQKL